MIKDVIKNLGLVKVIIVNGKFIELYKKIGINSYRLYDCVGRNISGSFKFQDLELVLEYYKY